MSWLHRIAWFAGILLPISAPFPLIGGMRGHVFALLFVRLPDTGFPVLEVIVPGRLAKQSIGRARAFDLRAVVGAGAIGRSGLPLTIGWTRGLVTLYGGNATTER